MRPFTFKDYDTFKGWWQEHHGIDCAPPYAVLPKDGLVYVDERKQMLACGFLYETNSPIAWLEWLTGCPQSIRGVRQYAVAQVAKALVALAKERGFNAVFTSYKTKSLGPILEDVGFKQTDEGMTQMIARLV